MNWEFLKLYREQYKINFLILFSGGEDSGGTDEADTFVSSTSRAAQLEAEKNDFRIKLAKLSTQVIDFCTKYKNNESEFNLEEAVKSLEESLNTNSSNSESQNSRVSNHENVQLQVKMELEHERRLRTQVGFFFVLTIVITDYLSSEYTYLTFCVKFWCSESRHALGIWICGCSLFYRRELWTSKSAGFNSTKSLKICKVQKVMIQRSTGSCTRANAFPVAQY